MDLNHIQDNLNDSVQSFDDSFVVSAFPLAFYHDYENFRYFEYSNKCIAPLTFLRQLSNFEETTVKFPVHFTIEGSGEVLSILEFKEDIDSFYIPNHIYEKLDTKKLANTGFTVSIKLETTDFEKATCIVLKPFRSTIYSITDIVKYLEIHFKKAYSCLKVGSIVPICYRDYSLDFEVLAINEVSPDSNSNNDGPTKPLVYSLIDTEVELVLDTPYDSDYKCS
mgnify:CR=1 FL=1|jgi:hypothetical protein